MQVKRKEGPTFRGWTEEVEEAKRTEKEKLGGQEEN